MYGKKNGVIMGDVNLGDICWRCHAPCNKTPLELKIMDDNFLAQNVLQPLVGNTVSDLIMRTKYEFITELVG